MTGLTTPEADLSWYLPVAIFSHEPVEWSPDVELRVADPSAPNCICMPVEPISHEPMMGSPVAAEFVRAACNVLVVVTVVAVGVTGLFSEPCTRDP
jgi:hypothetical protein